MPSALVLDSFALLAFLRDEPGGEAVGAILERAGQRDQPVAMTEANYAEVQSIIRRKDGDAAWADIARELRAVPIEFHPITRRLADAFAAALAKELNTPLVTGDPEFKPLENDIKIQWLT